MYSNFCVQADQTEEPQNVPSAAASADQLMATKQTADMLQDNSPYTPNADLSVEPDSVSENDSGLQTRNKSAARFAGRRGRAAPILLGRSRGRGRHRLRLE